MTKIKALLTEAKIGSLKLSASVACSSGTSLEKVIQLMQEQRSGYVVIVENQKVLGIFTEKDLTLNILNKNVSMMDPVRKHMNTSITTLTLNDSIAQAIDHMYNYEYRHIALVDKDRNLAGVLSARAIIRFLAEHYPAEVLNLPPRPDQLIETREGG